MRLHRGKVSSKRTMASFFEARWHRFGWHLWYLVGINPGERYQTALRMLLSEA